MLKKVKQHLEVLFMTKTEDEWFLWNSNDDIGFAVFFQLPRSYQSQSGIKSNLNELISPFSYFFLLLTVMKITYLLPNRWSKSHRRNAGAQRNCKEL
uniref:Uncharacterized protein n=1 Tax=Glossina palpalis gambiensis TaxID=67801 RepID=A0A1B0C1Z1_9MUSC